MDLRGLDLVDAVVVAANPPVVAALSLAQLFYTRISTWYFQLGYTETIKVLAVAEGRPTPDLQHNVLQLISL